MDEVGASAAAFFGGMVDRYDSLIRRAVPRYDEMTSRLLEYMPASAAQVLELGCGTGNLTLGLLRRYPQARVVTVDAAEEMAGVTAARARDAGCSARLEVIAARFEDLGPRL